MPEKCTAVPVMRSPQSIGELAGPHRRRILSAQDPQQLFELHAHLFDDLLALAHVEPRFLARQLVARTADREALLVEQRTDLANDDDVLSLVVAAVAATLHRLEL